MAVAHARPAGHGAQQLEAAVAQLGGRIHALRLAGANGLEQGEAHLQAGEVDEGEADAIGDLHAELARRQRVAALKLMACDSGSLTAITGVFWMEK